VYVSFDAGANWQTLSRNLPAVPDRGSRVRHDDLYAATEGRSFWALDDLSALRADDASGNGGGGPPVHAPSGDARRWSRPPRRHLRGRNPPSGANIYYWLAPAP
jgi:hypothetical protein